MVVSKRVTLKSRSSKRKYMITWIHRFMLFMLLFGVSALVYGGNQGSPLLTMAVNGIALVGIPALVLLYISQPGLYKVIAWLLVLGVIGLVLESRYEYGQFVYSYFVIKRFVYCGLALSAYYAISKVEPFKFEHVVYLIFGFFFVNQILLGQIFQYSLSSESRTTSAFEALYLVIPFLYYLVLYLKHHRLLHLIVTLFTFAFIVFLLHRSVISTAVVAGVIIFGLLVVGRLAVASMPIGRTVAVFAVILTLVIPSLSLLPETKTASFMESMAGMLDPQEDNTGSWRVEQSTYYLSQIPERPLFGWRYDGYDRGEIMENEDFPEKGTIIHSQYIDMLYNYGAVGLAINLLLILGTLITIYRRNRTFTTEQTVLFGFIASGLVFAISYQLPVYYWGFVGIGMHYGLSHSNLDVSISYPPQQAEPDVVVHPAAFAENQLNP